MSKIWVLFLLIFFCSACCVESPTGGDCPELATNELLTIEVIKQTREGAFHNSNGALLKVIQP